MKELCEKRKLEWDTMRKSLKAYYPVREELIIVDGILMRGQRMIIPLPLRKLKLHSAYQGVTKCKREPIRKFGGQGSGNRLKKLYTSVRLAANSGNKDQNHSFQISLASHSYGFV